jgi:hypothetical protein
MADETEVELNAVDAGVLRGMAAAVGVSLASDFAAMLAPQAEQHFAQLRYLKSIADPNTEPAAEFRLDGWTRPGSD